MTSTAEDFLNCSDDFLTNGFYQLYTEFNDEQFHWNNSLSPIQRTYDDNLLETCQSNEATLDADEQNMIINTTSNSSSSSYNDDDDDGNNTYWQLEPISGQSQTIFDPDWTLNIESLLYELNEPITTSTSSWQDTLPEKTWFCNDSCTQFLAESSKNLLYTPEKSVTETTKKRVELNQIVDSSNDSVEKMLVCTYDHCKKVYAKPAHLKAHLRRHAGDKPYVCTWPNCTWKFSRSDELSRHRRSHSGLKPYRCCYCTKCFSRSDHLTKHRKVHERKMEKLKGITEMWNKNNISGKKSEVCNFDNAKSDCDIVKGTSDFSSSVQNSGSFVRSSGRPAGRPKKVTVLAK